MRKFTQVAFFGFIWLFTLSSCVNNSSSGGNSKPQFSNEVKNENENKPPLEAKLDDSLATSNKTSSQLNELTKSSSQPHQTADTIDLRLNEPVEPYKIGSDSNYLFLDSLEQIEQDSSFTEAPEQTDLEIISEELLASITIDLPIKDSMITNPQIDSILSVESDISSDLKKSLTIEFWEHPLYSAQYSMNGKVLKLYGVTPDNTVEIRQLQDQRYLMVNGAFYNVENSFSLRPLKTELDSFKIFQLELN